MFHNTIFFQAQKRALNQHTDSLACLNIICVDEWYSPIHKTQKQDQTLMVTDHVLNMRAQNIIEVILET